MWDPIRDGLAGARVSGTQVVLSVRRRGLGKRVGGLAAFRSRLWSAS
ncbi:hypothetical protein [Limnothrix redekei]|uniref:Uncharacterized protein n=1 Tax=Limnothrix redekei LRLZ20PSL1 TaxID=3112953 RepID=A0ABW7CC79_9CYAN